MNVDTPINPLDDFFRYQQTDARWVFEAGLVVWHSPHEPSLEWKRFRTWKTEPTPARLAKARIAASKRYFRTCTLCKTLCNRGHMHDRTTCQGCAEKFLGVVY
jgi:hypothetical protein